MKQIIKTKDVKKMVNFEEARLCKIAMKEGDPLVDDNIAGYIVGTHQLAANLQVMLGNHQYAEKNEENCWFCGQSIPTGETCECQL